MEERQKSGELLPTWNTIKGKHKALSNGLFRPDLAAVLKTYDQGLQNYDKFLEQKKKLCDVIAELTDAINAQIQAANQHYDQFDKINAQDRDATNKNKDLLNKYRQDPDSNPADVLAAFGGLLDAINDRRTLTKALWDKWEDHEAKYAALAKKTRDDYKAKSDAITNGIKKLESDEDRLEAQIRQIATNYQKIAVQMDHDEIVDDIRDLVGML